MYKPLLLIKSHRPYSRHSTPRCDMAKQYTHMWSFEEQTGLMRMSKEDLTYRLNERNHQKMVKMWSKFSDHFLLYFFGLKVLTIS